MTGKTPRRPKAAIVAAIVVALVAILAGLAVVLGFWKPQAPSADPNVADPKTTPQVLGPDTAQGSSGDPATPDATPTQLADGDPVASPQSSGSQEPDIAVTPSRVSFDSEALSFDAVLPIGAADDPVLAYLRKDSQGYLARMKKGANAQLAEMKRDGQPAHPWEVRVKWSYTAKADGVVSLVGESSEFNGGAHPALLFDSLIARSTGEKLNMSDLLLIKRSPSPAMTIAICEALKTAKAERIGSATIFDEPIVCAGPNANAKVDNAVFALAPSSLPNRFGGIYAFYAPYIVGSNAEGAYRLTVQQAIFVEDLKPEFKALFDGEAPALRE
jgi:hypothetical protein